MWFKLHRNVSNSQVYSNDEFDLWPVYSGERFRAFRPSCLWMVLPSIHFSLFGIAFFFLCRSQAIHASRIIYALLYTRATLNEREFSDVVFGCRISIFAVAITLLEFSLYLSYITGNSMQYQAPSVTYWRIKPPLRAINMYIWDRSFTLRQFY